MTTIIKLERTNFCSCDNGIHKKIGEILGVFAVRIDYAKSEIAISHTDEIDPSTLEELINRLLEKS